MKERLIRILYDADENRLRAGWRILLFIALLIGISVGLQFVISKVLPELPDDRTRKMLAMISLAAFVGTLTTVIARRFLDRRTLVSLGLRLDSRAVKDWLFGFALSAAMAAAVFLIHRATGLMEYRGVNTELTTPAFLVDLLLMFVTYCILVAWWEELVFRGYLLQNMIDGMGKFWAVVLSCLIYGLVHYTNPNAGILSSTIIVLFGYLRLYGYLETSQLWLSMGMHAAWNFFQGPVFGYAASGYETRTIFLHEATGPDWLTGGSFGPEGSVITIPIVLLALGAMYWWSRRNSEFELQNAD